jgi:hypothetical protein
MNSSNKVLQEDYAQSQKPNTNLLIKYSTIATAIEGKDRSNQSA